ncbi:hypothetical protein ABZP36_004365 [Zizania latifolia]
MRGVPARLPPIARPITSRKSSSSSSSSPAVPDSSTTSLMNKNTEVEIEGARPDLLGYGLVLPELQRLVQEYINQKEKERLAMGVGQDDQLGERKHSIGVDQDQLGDCKQAMRVKQDQVGKEEEGLCLRSRLQDINGEQLVGSQLPLIFGKKKTQGLHGVEEEISQFPVSDIQFGSIIPINIPLEGRRASIDQPNPDS